MRATRRHGRKDRQGGVIGRASGLMALVVLVGVSACGSPSAPPSPPGPVATGASSGTTSAPGPGTGSLTGAPPAPVTTGPAGVTGPPPVTGRGSPAVTGGAAPAMAEVMASTTTAICSESIGATLRERTTVTTSNLVTVLPGGLPCSGGIGLWAATFTLDGDPALDLVPQFGARYTGAQQLAVRLPAVTGHCAAAAVFFAVDAPAVVPAGAAAGTASRVREDLAGWPADSRGLVPGGGILQGRSSAVLAGSVVGNPSECSPGESVSSPVAAVNDCWTAVPATGAGGAVSPAAAGTVDSATRFRRATCTAPHTHEVYWAENLAPAQYLADGGPGEAGAAAAWARLRAEKACARRSSVVDLAGDVNRTEVFLELLWPSTLSYPPPSATGWAKAQIVCLARWKNGTSSVRQILHR
ncbi:MAG: hypothetical protein QG622_447 [Actinomycetota bacterium]|nr:hypothetical protein [Actinomycetota bacterium]